MAAYYNEINPYAAQWLRNLISAGQIARSDVDERSIVEVRAADLDEYDQCHFFAGVGGWSIALRLAGWDDDRPVWTGSCPCQPFSGANKGARGEADERDLWPEWFRLIGECCPADIFGEQVASGDGPRWLSRVRADLENAAYAIGACNLPAGIVGAPHKRERLWFVAVGFAESLRRREGVKSFPGPQGRGQDGRQSAWTDASTLGGDGRRRRSMPGAPVVAHGIPERASKLRAYGNAIVPQVAAEFVKASFMEMNNG